MARAFCENISHFNEITMKNNRNGKFLNYKFMKHNRLVPSGLMRWKCEAGKRRKRPQCEKAMLKGRRLSSEHQANDPRLDYYLKNNSLTYSHPAQAQDINIYCFSPFH